MRNSILWTAFLTAVFPGSKEWAWRRRVALTSAIICHIGIVNSIFFDKDIAHASMVMSNCITGMLAVLTVYVGGAVTDDALRRMNDTRAARYVPTESPNH